MSLFATAHVCVGIGSETPNFLLNRPMAKQAAVERQSFQTYSEGNHEQVKNAAAGHQHRPVSTSAPVASIIKLQSRNL